MGLKYLSFQSSLNNLSSVYGACSVHRNPDYTSGCNVRFEEPLKSDTAFFNQFIDGASCLTDNFLQKGEEANPYEWVFQPSLFSYYLRFYQVVLWLAQ